MRGRVWIAAAACVAVSTFVAVCTYSSSTLVLDHWDDFSSLIQFSRGAITRADFFQPHNEHIIAVPRLLFLVDFIVFRFSNHFLIWLNVSGLSAICLLYLSALRFPRLSRQNTTFLTGLTVMMILSAVQYDNIFLGFQVQFVLVHLAPTAAVLCALHAAQEHGTSWAWWRVAIACGVVATLSMANGVLVWPCLVVLALGYRPRLARALVVLGVSVCAVVLFARVNPQVQGRGLAVVQNVVVLARPAGIRAAYYIASPFLVAEGIAGVVGAAGWALGLGAGVYHVVQWRKLDAARWFHLILLCFMAGTAGITSAGRVYFPPEHMLSSRYATPALLFWLSSVTLVVLALDGRRGAGVFRGGVVVLCAGLLVPSHILALREVGRAYREREQAALTLIVGVYDDDVDLALHTSPIKMRRALPFLRTNHLNIFRPQWTHYMGQRFSTLYPDGDTQTCAGTIEHAEPVPYATEGETRSADTLNGTRVWGWALPERTAKPPPLVVLVDHADRVCGLARPGTSVGVATAGTLPKSARIGMLGDRARDRVARARVAPKPPLHYGPGTWFGYSVVDVELIRDAYAVWPRDGRAQRLRAPTP